jgi:hypothetical protein
MEIYLLIIFLFYFFLIIHSINQYYSNKEGLTDGTDKPSSTSSTLLNENIQIQPDTTDDNNLNIVKTSLQNYLAKRDANADEPPAPTLPPTTTTTTLAPTTTTTTLAPTTTTTLAPTTTTTTLPPTTTTTTPAPTPNPNCVIM